MTNVLRSRWKLLIALVVVPGTVMLCLFVGKMRERKEFIADAVDGFRYRCALSTDWQSTKDDTHYLVKMPGIYNFAPAPSLIQEWISSHLGQPYPVKGNFPAVPTVIQMHTNSVRSPNNSILIQAGYPEPKWGGMRPHILTERHLRIGSYPATVLTWEMANTGFSEHGTALLVYQTENGNTYVVSGMAEPQSGGRVDREMEGIVESFHVEKVVPEGGTR